MKMSRLLYTILIIFYGFIYTSHGWAEKMNYQRGDAVKYASDHCGSPDPYSSTNGYNFKDYKCWNGELPECENYPGAKTDCTNFASQALIEGFGGNSFGCVSNANIIGRDGVTKGEISVRQLETQLTTNFCFEIITDPAEMQRKAQEGDILSLKNGSHVAIYGGNNQFYAHTTDRCGSRVNWDAWILYHFLDDDKCKKCERDEKTCKADSPSNPYFDFRKENLLI